VEQVAKEDAGVEQAQTDPSAAAAEASEVVVVVAVAAEEVAEKDLVQMDPWLVLAVVAQTAAQQQHVAVLETVQMDPQVAVLLAVAAWVVAAVVEQPVVRTDPSELGSTAVADVPEHLWQAIWKALTPQA